MGMVVAVAVGGWMVWVAVSVMGGIYRLVRCDNIQLTASTTSSTVVPMIASRCCRRGLGVLVGDAADVTCGCVVGAGGAAISGALTASATMDAMSGF